MWKKDDYVGLVDVYMNNFIDWISWSCENLSEEKRGEFMILFW